MKKIMDIMERMANDIKRVLQRKGDVDKRI